MNDIDLLSDKYSSLQERFDQIKKDPPASDSEFREALSELAEAARELKKVTAGLGKQYEQKNSYDTPDLRLAKKDSD